MPVDLYSSVDALLLGSRTYGRREARHIISPRSVGFALCHMNFSSEPRFGCPAFCSRAIGDGFASPTGLEGFRQWCRPAYLPNVQPTLSADPVARLIDRVGHLLEQSTDVLELVSF
jgi:hypothetical protein